MNVYRISSCGYINDLSGKGAAMYGGRWNNKDTFVVYTAESRALALLEAVVHNATVPQQGYCIATISIPDDSIETIADNDLPPNWNSNPPPDAIKEIGDRFVRTKKYFALKIPSVLIYEEHNYLLNPTHPRFQHVKIIEARKINPDERLFPKE